MGKGGQRGIGIVRSCHCKWRDCVSSHLGSSGGVELGEREEFPARWKVAKGALTLYDQLTASEHITISAHLGGVELSDVDIFQLDETQLKGRWPIIPDGPLMIPIDDPPSKHPTRIKAPDHRQVNRVSA
jgi:hypothetical protein